MFNLVNKKILSLIVILAEISEIKVILTGDWLMIPFLDKTDSVLK